MSTNVYFPSPLPFRFDHKFPVPSKFEVPANRSTTMATSPTSTNTNSTNSVSLHRQSSKNADSISICSTTSAFSTCPDRHGFYGGTQFSEKPAKETLTREQIMAREKKWLHMTNHWQEYMSKNYKKVCWVS